MDQGENLKSSDLVYGLGKFPIFSLSGKDNSYPSTKSKYSMLSGRRL